jgi:hypothetical protein
MAATAAAPQQPRDSDEREWEEEEEEEVMVLVDLPEFAGADLFDGARSIEIRVRRAGHGGYLDTAA